MGRRTSRRFTFDQAVAGTEPRPTSPGVVAIDLAALVYTSGSTGNPKGGCSRIRTWCSRPGASRIPVSTRRTGIVNVLPFAFDYGLYQLLDRPDGGNAARRASFVYPVPVLKRIIEHEVTVFPIVPTIGATLLSLNRSGGWTFPTVRRVTNTAAALPAEFIPKLATVFPNYTPTFRGVTS
jgi:acyl-CoA synthetase (AMP-forming)/AMP-acid ligase II